jgi:LysM repeat protein
MEGSVKTFVIALAAALLIAGQFLTPVSAAPASSEVTFECGTTYVVTSVDNLTTIAKKCNTTIADILARNPQIKNPNVIRTGSTLNISGSAPLVKTYVGTYTVQSGDTISSIASKFGVTIYALEAANPYVWNTGTIYVGQVLYIPPATYKPTTSTGTSTAYTYISLSTSSVTPGGSVTVYVHGFTADASIDYRVYKSGQAYSKAYDGTVGSDGNTSLTITVPSSAVKGETWYVLVTTTDQVQGMEATSPSITIN